MTEHWVEFVQLLHAPANLVGGYSKLFGKLGLLGPGLRQELVQRRIQGSDRRRQSFERLEDANEILTLIGKQLRERGFTLVHRRREDHLAHRVNAIALEEHMLGPG